MSLLESQAFTSNAAAEAGAPDVPQILVTDAQLARRLQPMWPTGLAEANIRVVDGFLAAMGALSQAPADVVIGSARQLSGMSAATAGGLRRLAPAARLIVIDDEVDGDDGAAAEALANGFDAMVAEPVDAPSLARALDRRAAQPEAGAEDTELGDAELGDVDLIEALLSPRDSLLATAMRVIHARCEIPGMKWAGPEQTIPENHAAAAVSYQGQAFGSLHAPQPVTASDIEPWAGWLSRWLTLRQQMHQLEELAMKDELTSAWNRRYFNRFLQRILDQAARDRSQVTLMVFDIDDFKLYNDTYGHPAGDEILREATRLMQSFVREHDVVARIGGDEFAVIFWDAHAKRKPDSHHPNTVRKAAKRFQQAICSHRFPKLLQDAPGTLTISGGLASFPWDGRTPEELLDKADAMAMQSKRQGKNAITFGPGAAKHIECAGD